jgi:hypothetical protein
MMMVVRDHAVYQHHREAEQQQYGYGSFPVQIKKILNRKDINNNLRIRIAAVKNS